MRQGNGYWRIFRETWRAKTKADRRKWIREHSDSELAAINWWLVHYARDKQVPPEGDWRIWLLLAGRGFGKSRAICEFGREQAGAMPESRGAIVARSAADARDVLIEGESGLLNISPPWDMPDYEPSKRRLTWDNGTTATVFSADKPEQLRGPQFHWAICDELAHWRYPEAWDMLMLALRLGDNPRCAVATTPRPIDIIKELMKADDVVVTRGSTYENRANLADAFFSQIITRYEGTHLGRQELYGEILADNPRALWKRDWIDHDVIEAPELMRVGVAVDPTGSKGGDECGIVGGGVARQDKREHLYVLEDASLHGSPDEWARAAVTLYHKLQADVIIAEKNNGGEMVEYTIRTIDRQVPVRLVHASRGKHVRAEPISAIYEQGRGHHVGAFPRLEDEMCQWEPGEDSPNRMDALVWLGSELVTDRPGMSDVPQAKSKKSKWDEFGDLGDMRWDI